MPRMYNAAQRHANIMNAFQTRLNRSVNVFTASGAFAERVRFSLFCCFLFFARNKAKLSLCRHKMLELLALCGEGEYWIEKRTESEVFPYFSLLLYHFHCHYSLHPPPFPFFFPSNFPPGPGKCRAVIDR